MAYRSDIFQQSRSHIVSASVDYVSTGTDRFRQKPGRCKRYATGSLGHFSVYTIITNMLVSAVMKNMV